MSSQETPGRLDGVDGQVKWFDPRKGFGFLVGPDGQDIFVHFSCIVGDGFRVLNDDAHVNYDAEETDKGWKATRVQLTEPTVVVPKRQYTRTPRR